MSDLSGRHYAMRCGVWRLGVVESVGLFFSYEYIWVRWALLAWWSLVDMAWSLLTVTLVARDTWDGCGYSVLLLITATVGGGVMVVVVVVRQL